MFINQIKYFNMKKMWRNKFLEIQTLAKSLKKLRIHNKMSQTKN